MKNFLLAGIMLFISCNDNNSMKSNNLKGDTDNGGLTLPKDFSALVVADNLGRGRHITVRENGDIYLALRNKENGHGIVALRDTTNDGKADIIKYFGDYAGTGIDIHKGYLYFASDTAVMRYKLMEGELLPDPNPEFIAGGFIIQYQHAVKPFTFDDNGNMYVNVGAPSNACQERMRTPGSPGLDPCPQLDRQAGVWKFKDDIQGQTQQKDATRYATGIRNAVALDWNHNSNHLYVVMHGRDQLNQFFPEYFEQEEGVELPSEEFLLVEEGDDFGWPYCYYDHFKGKKVLAPEYGGDGEMTGRCEKTKDPIMGFPAHYAPNDIIFYQGSMFPGKYHNGAFIAFHGSWNRAPEEQKGYFVVFVPFEKEFPSGDWEIFANGFAGIDYIASPGDAEHRPCGVAEGPDGSLYISDSVTGKIWRIIYK